MIRRFVSRFLADRSASAAAEMMLVMPILFVLMFTTFEGGHYMWTEHKALKGVRDGARFAARLPFEYYSCSNTSLVAPTSPGSATAATRITQIKNLTRTGQLSGGSAKIPGWGATDDVVVTVACNGTYTQGLYANVTGGAPHVTVSTIVPYPAILGLLGFDTSGLGVRAQANAAVTGL